MDRMENGQLKNWYNINTTKITCRRTCITQQTTKIDDDNNNNNNNTRSKSKED
jgi:hypothetical protein